jgi:hypothetical protein
VYLCVVWCLKGQSNPILVTINCFYAASVSNLHRNSDCRVKTCLYILLNVFECKKDKWQNEENHSELNKLLIDAMFFNYRQSKSTTKYSDLAGVAYMATISNYRDGILQRVFW